MASRPLAGTGLVLLAFAVAVRAEDKNGVAPWAISLPSGPGSVQGLGESFQPQINHGGATYRLALPLPTGTSGHTPELHLSYDAGAANGCFGLGWALNGAVSIRRNIDLGIPRYVDADNGLDDDADGVEDNPEEIDVFSGLDREELVPLGNGSYRVECEGAFTQYQRSGEGWVARRRDGTQLELGMTSASRIEHGSRVFAWLLDRVIDTDGNAIAYEYASEPGSPGQKYLRAIRWGQPSASIAALLTYAPGRPDVFSDFRSGFEIRTAQRAVRLDVFSEGLPARVDALRGDLDENGVTDALIRRWTFEYHDDAPVSLLRRVTSFGCDGATALPPATFEYTRWTPPTEVAAQVVSSLGEPAETLSSPSVELCDMNGDGLPDLLSTSGIQHRVATNLGMTDDGRLAWGPLTPVGNAPTIDIGSPTAHLADATGDGLSDLIVKVTNTHIQCFDNTGQNAWVPSPVPIRSTDTWPIWPFEGDNGTASRSVDTDHNRRNDILYTAEWGYSLWLFLPNRQYAKEMRLAPLICEEKTFRFDLPGTHIADLNGDRLQDLAWVQPTRVVWFPNHGRGEFGEVQILPLGRTLTASDIEKSGFSDIDGDGLEDLTVVRPASAPRSVLYWLNRFQNGLEGPRQLDGLPAALAGDTLRWADMNGSGSTDIVIANSARPAGSRLLVVELLPEGKPYVLTSAENGIGLVQRLEIESSTDQMVRARRGGTPWTSTLQFSVSVVKRLVEDDGRGNVNVREFTYRDPFWSSAKQEFRGFQSVRMREVGDESAPDRVSSYRFDAGFDADCMKGKPLFEEILDATGKVFLREENFWVRRVLAVGQDDREVSFAFAARTDVSHIEGSEDAITTRVERDYDAFGNVILEHNQGVVDAPGDESVVESDYEVRQDVWIIDRPARKTTLDGEGRRMAEERYTYDTRGRLVLQEAWLDSEDRFIPLRRQSFDAFGNVVEVLDANGHRRTVEYDPLLHAYAVRERYNLEDRTLEMLAEYDLGLGVVVRGTEISGAQHFYEHDPLARIVRLNAPGGAQMEIEYHLASPVSQVITRKLENAGGGTLDSFAYFDGYGRELGTKIEGEGGQWRFLGARQYNSRKLERRRWLPLETSGPEYVEPAEAERHDDFRYDALGRVTETGHSDASVLRNVYEPLAVTHFDENDTASRSTPATIHRDGLGRIASVVERGGPEDATTTYRWNPLGKLVEMRDAQRNVKSLEYDSLQRVRAVRDPDRGVKVYVYDDASNLVRTVDAKGQVIQYRYDFCDRLVEEVHGESGSGVPRRVVYRYDVPSEDLGVAGERVTAAFTRGRLAAVVDSSGETHFSYDARGNRDWIVNRIREPRSGLLVSYLTRFEYDLLDRATEVVFPDGDRVRQIYGDGETLQRIDGGPQGVALVNDVRHHPSGQVARIEYANGVTSSYTFDARDRLSTLLTRGPSGDPLIDNEYRYDPASNVVAIVDRRPVALTGADSPRRNTQVFEYDALHRLTSVRYTPQDDLAQNLGQIDYAYDAIGNLVAKSTPAPGQPGHLASLDLALGEITYGAGKSADRTPRQPWDPPGPHAATRTASGRVYEYDANGNMTSRDGARLTWDDKDQLVGYEVGATAASYVYDYADRRVAKSVDTSLRKGETTIYVNAYYEERPGGTPVKFVFDGATRVARVEGSIDTDAPKIQRIRLASGWNAVTAAVNAGGTLAQVFGAEATCYAFRDGRYEVLAANEQIVPGEPLWVHSPTARLCVLKGAEFAPLGPTPVPDGGGWLAWASLQAFQPRVHLSAAARTIAYDSAATRWLLHDESLPSFLQDFSGALPSAGALWIDAAPGTLLLPPPPRSPRVLFYHGDHLGSTSVVSDGAGRLHEEIAYYPFGQIRNRYLETEGAPAVEHDFTGKETDTESGLTQLGARSYDAVLGRFASVDPLFGNPAALDGNALDAFLEEPQKLGLYSYALNNPVRYYDPDGLEAHSSRQTIQRTAAEASAFADFNLRLFDEAVFQRPIPRQSTWLSVRGTDKYFELPAGKSAESFRAGWRQVTVQFQIKDPSGNPVPNHFFSVRFQGKDGTAINNVRTDARGFVKFITDVPARGGKLALEGAFEQGGQLKVANTRGWADFRRESGESKLKFEVNLKNWSYDDGQLRFNATDTEVNQKR